MHAAASGSLPARGIAPPLRFPAWERGGGGGSSERWTDSVKWKVLTREGEKEEEKYRDRDTQREIKWQRLPEREIGGGGGEKLLLSFLILLLFPIFFISRLVD